MSDHVKIISFNALVKDRNADVRVTSDNLVCAADLTGVMTGKNCNHANECLRDLDPSLFNNDKFVMRGRSRYVTFENAIQLIMVLPGKIAKETRSQFADIIRRYMAGDQSLHVEIEKNAASTSPIAEMARASLDTDPALERIKKRQLELDELSFQERQLELQSKQASIRAQEIENVLKFKSIMDMLDPTWERDTRLKLNTKDWVLNVAFGQTNTKAIENGEAGQAKLITISDVAQKLGYRLKQGDLTTVGKRVAKAYVKEHNENPPKSSRFVDGAVRDVNGYTQRDWGLIEDVIKEYVQECGMEGA